METEHEPLEEEIPIKKPIIFSFPNVSFSLGGMNQCFFKNQGINLVNKTCPSSTDGFTIINWGHSLVDWSAPGCTDTRLPLKIIVHRFRDFLEKKRGDVGWVFCKVNVVKKKTQCFSLNIVSIYGYHTKIFQDSWTHHCVKTTKKI